MKNTVYMTMYESWVMVLGSEGSAGGAAGRARGRATVNVPVARGRHELRDIEANEGPYPKEEGQEIGWKRNLGEDGRELLDDLPRVDGDLGADHKVAAAADGIRILVRHSDCVEAVGGEG